MIASFVALAVTLSPAAPLADAVHLALAATTTTKKKKKKPADPPPETSEGLDLTEPPPAPEPTPAPAPVEPPAPPEPPPPPPHSWSVVTPHTAGAGENQLEAGFGYPGFHAAYWHGLREQLDIGARIDLNYGYEDIVTAPQFGLDVRAQAKYRFLEKEKFSLGATFKPGLLFYFPPNRGAHVGLSLPLGVNAGYAFNDKLNFGATFEIPLFVIFGTGTVFPLLLGVGAEYFLSEKLALFAAVRVGPGVWTNGSGAVFMLDAKAGVGFHL